MSDIGSAAWEYANGVTSEVRDLSLRQALETALENHGNGYSETTIVHRRFDGEHRTAGEDCWCGPVVLRGDVSQYKPEELLEQLLRTDG